MSSSASREAERVMRTIFRRCVQCPNNQIPACPDSCPTGQICVQVPPDCNTCASTKCAPASVDPTVSDSGQHSGPNVGAIAGGVVGGVGLVAIVIFLVWKFYWKGRKREIEEAEWQEVNASEKPDNDFASRRSARASTHTVASMASSVLTRASNIIQIAYIPGVTNRSGPGSPDLLVPPVPPIPIATTNSSALTTPYSTSEQHFFVPDLRDSTYSGTSDGRSSYARTSITPSLARSSVATTIYRNNAIVSPLPAQTIVRGKAAVVSVKSSNSNSPAESPGMEAPPVPQIDPKHNAPSKPIRFQVPGLSPQSSIRSTATLGPVRALTITKKNKGENASSKSSGSSDSADTALVPPVRPLTDGSLASTDDGLSHARARRTGDLNSDSDSDGDDYARAQRTLLHTSSSVRDSDITVIQDSPSTLQSPFSDSSHITDSPMSQRHMSTFSNMRPPLTPVMEESSKRASRASRRTQSPFSDDNEVSN